MCALSQFEISDAARMIHSGKQGHRIVAVLQFKFDESYDDRVMSLGGWIASEHEWKKLESTWQRRIDFENKHNRPDQQITRFHATQVNGGYGEFVNWDKEMRLRFSKDLIGLVAKRKMGALAVACDMEAIQSVFPKGDSEGKHRRGYVLCMKQMMVDIASVTEEIFPGDTVLLVHDHGNWDQAALQAYNLLIDDPDWPRQKLFEGLLAKTGREAVGLQAADMIAYEVFKGVKAKTIDSDAQMRSSMKAIVDHKPIRARCINRAAAQALYQFMKNSGKYPKLDEMGVC